MGNGVNITPAIRLAIAVAATGVGQKQAAQVLGISVMAYNSRMSSAAEIYRARSGTGYPSDTLGIVKCAEADGLIEAPRRIAGLEPAAQ